MLRCRWCGREIDLPLGDECSRCQQRLNSRTQVAGPQKLVFDGQRVGLYFQGCTLSLLDEGGRSTRIEFDYHATRSRVLDDISIFFSHPERIEITELRGLEEVLFAPRRP